MTENQNQFEKFCKTPAIDLISDEIDLRYPHLAKLLYLSYRFGYHGIRETLLNKLAQAADEGIFDDWE